MLDSSLVAVLGRLHPVVLHLPIGILVALALLEVVALVRGRPPAREARVGLAWMGAVFAVVSVATGLTLSRESSYTHDGVWWHQWLGIATGVMALGCALLASAGRVPRWAYPGALLATVGLLVPAGHLGAELTHGQGYVLGPLVSRAGPVEVAAPPARGGGDGAGVPMGGDDPYAGIDPAVAGIFKTSCVKCHNEVKLKGGLALDSAAGLRNGGDDGAVVVPGNPGRSEMMIRLLLTPGDKEHMPPPGKKALSAEEVEVIRRWIESGAAGMEAGRP